jgi:hypothetical protein
LQLEAGVCIPPAHEAPAPQGVPAGYCWHAPVVSAHAPSVPHDAAPWSGQAAPQQTPFAPHTPLVQSAPPSVGLQPEPGAPSPTHTEPLQWLPAAHCAPAVQLV